MFLDNNSSFKICTNERLSCLTLPWHHDKANHEKFDIHCIVTLRDSKKTISESRCTVVILNSHKYFELFQSYAKIFLNEDIRKISDQFIKWNKFNLPDFNDHLALLKQDWPTEKISQWKELLPRDYDYPSSFKAVKLMAKSGDVFVFPRGTIHAVTSASTKLFQIKVYPEYKSSSDRSRIITRASTIWEKKKICSASGIRAIIYDDCLSPEQKSLWKKYSIFMFSLANGPQLFDSIVDYTKQLCGFPQSFDLVRHAACFSSARYRRHHNISDAFIRRQYANPINQDKKCIYPT